MFTIIGGDGKEYGPVSAEQIRSWLTGGRANLDTKAKAVGSEAWQRLGDFPEFSGASVRAATPPPIPVTVSDPGSFVADLNSRATPIDISACIGRAFTLWKTHFLPLVGVTLLVFVVQTVAGMIPFLGILSSLLLNGVFVGGLYYYYLGKLRGEPREVADAFAGFTRALVPLMLATLLTSVIMIALVGVFSAPLFFYFIKMAMQGANHISAFPEFSPLALIGFCVGGLIMIYLSVSWVFTFPLIIDQGLGPWTAMEVSRRLVGRQWFRVFALLFLGGILAVLGLIALFIGVFFTLPIIFCVVACAYEHICRPPPRV